MSLSAVAVFDEHDIAQTAGAVQLHDAFCSVAHEHGQHGKGMDAVIQKSLDHTAAVGNGKFRAHVLPVFQLVRKRFGKTQCGKPGNGGVVSVSQRKQPFRPGGGVAERFVDKDRFPAAQRRICQKFVMFGGTGSQYTDAVTFFHDLFDACAGSNSHILAPDIQRTLVRQGGLLPCKSNFKLFCQRSFCHH